MDEFYTFEPCASSNSFEIRFKKQINLDKIDFGNVLAKTGVVMLLKFDGAAISIYTSGKAMMKNIEAKKAKKLARVIYCKLKELRGFE